MRENIRQIESGLYVAADGNWGDAASMCIIDDRDWDTSDYDLLDCASDGERADLAEAISMWIAEERPSLEDDILSIEGGNINDFVSWEVSKALLARYMNR